MIHHYTIRTYTAMLLELFNDLEIQYKLDDSTVKTKNIPIVYSTREKALILDKVTREQILSGNLNVLPRASLVLSGLEKTNQRTTNKNIKTNKLKKTDTFEYSWNSVPYAFNYELIIQCRGMNELASIIEQIAPQFNPTVEIDVADAQNLTEYTRVPVSLMGIDWDDGDGYNELSSNIFTLTVQVSVQGSLYPPIKEIDRIKEFKMFLNETNDDGETYNRRFIMNWDVDTAGEVENEETVTIDNVAQYPPVITGLVCDNFTIGENEIVGVWTDEDDKISEDTFEFEIMSGNDYVDSYSNDDNVLTITILDDTESGSEVEIQFKVTDVYGNFDTISKVFTI